MLRTTEINLMLRRKITCGLSIFELSQHFTSRMFYSIRGVPPTSPDLYSSSYFPMDDVLYKSAWISRLHLHGTIYTIVAIQHHDALYMLPGHSVYFLIAEDGNCRRAGKLSYCIETLSLFLIHIQTLYFYTGHAYT